MQSWCWPFCWSPLRILLFYSYCILFKQCFMGVYPLSTPKTHRFSALFCFMGGTMGSYSHFLVYTKSSLVEQTTPVFLTLDEVFWGLQKKGPEDWWQVKTLKNHQETHLLVDDWIGWSSLTVLLFFFLNWPLDSGRDSNPNSLLRIGRVFL